MTLIVGPLIKQDYKIYIFVILLSIGCFWQIFNVCDMYFQYPTNVYIETTFDPLTKPVPALTFVKNIGSHWNSGLNTSTVLEYQSSKIKNYLFSSIYIQRSTKYYYYLDQYMNTAIERVSNTHYSITLNSLLTGNKSTEIKPIDELWLKFNDYGYPGSIWWLYMHESFDMPSTSEWNTISIEFNKSYQVSWKLQSFRLLESPYGTNCKNYRKSSEYLSRRDCLRMCKLNASLSECGFIYNGIDVGRGEPSVPFGWSECVEENDFDSICRKRCPHYDCAIDYYKPIIEGKTDYQGTQLLIHLPYDPETIYYHKPKIATIEFICYLASTFSMWFGFSIYSLYYLLNSSLSALFKFGEPNIQLNKQFDNYSDKNIVNSPRKRIWALNVKNRIRY